MRPVSSTLPSHRHAYCLHHACCPSLPAGGSGFLPAPPRAVAAAAARFCSAPKAAPGALLKALDGGGAGARAAVAALLEGCPQGGLDIMNSVLAELVDSEEMQSPATTYG